MQIVGVVGGSVGSEPFAKKTWSGSSSFLFRTLQSKGALSRAFGVKLTRLEKSYYMARNFNRSRVVWRKQFYADKAYRDALDRQLLTLVSPQDCAHSFLQVGAMFNVSKAVSGRAKCFSFHDGTFAEFLRSPYCPAQMSAVRIEECLKYEREVYHSMDRVLAMSEFHRQSFIRDYDVPAARTVNVGCAINLDRIPEYYPNKAYDSNELLFIGVDFNRKGGPLLLRAFKLLRRRFPAAKLHIVGPRRISESIPDGVSFHGFLDKENPVHFERLEALFRKCSLFVLPSLYEGVGVSSLEAMVHQLPCLVTNGWGFPDAVHSGETGDLVKAGNLEDLVDKLVGHMQDPQRLRLMGDKARSLVLSEFTWSTVVERILSALTKAYNTPL